MEELLKRVFIGGNGDPVLLIHGMGGPGSVEPLLQELMKHFKVIRPVLPGFLRGDGFIRYSDKRYVAYIDSIVNALQLRQVWVIGYSMGGRTAINYALTYGAKVNKLILIDSVGIGYMNPLLITKRGRRIFSTLAYQLLKSKHFQRAYGKMDFKYPDSTVCKQAMNAFGDMMRIDTVRKNNANILSCIGRPIGNINQKLSNLHIGTLILWASQDKTAPISWGHKLHKLLPDSQLKILEGYRHMALVENPSFFTEYIIKYLKPAE